MYWIFLVDQEDRTRSVNQFRNREKDVLVATDVASKGLDFPDIQHVINYDMPEDIENYGMTDTVKSEKFMEIYFLFVFLVGIQHF